MASAHGIKVEVQTDGQGLRCYDDPDEAPNGKPGVVKKYIEAVTDATFMIGISLTRDFSFGKCDGIKASVVMHGRDVGMCFIPQKASYDMDRQPKMVYTAPYEYCAASGKWRRCTWSFAKLNIQETADVETPSQEIKHLGIITVSLQRVYQVDCRPIPTRREKEHQWITEVPEKLLKGKAISNSISIVKGSITTEPPPLKHRYVPITGQMGEPMEFTFLYRSK
ncbi:hypothetical protein MMC08_008832, partial [Hypocenomyce scalaris]|nr:hypothetical protein [Hypocenomyce scalaris]